MSRWLSAARTKGMIMGLFFYFKPVGGSVSSTSTSSRLPSAPSYTVHTPCFAHTQDARYAGRALDVLHAAASCRNSDFRSLLVPPACKCAFAVLIILARLHDISGLTRTQHSLLSNDGKHSFTVLHTYCSCVPFTPSFSLSCTPCFSKQRVMAQQDEKRHSFWKVEEMMGEKASINGALYAPVDFFFFHEKVTSLFCLLVI